MGASLQWMMVLQRGNLQRVKILVSLDGKNVLGLLRVVVRPFCYLI